MNFEHINTWEEAGMQVLSRQGSYGTESRNTRSYICPKCAAIVVSPKEHKAWHDVLDYTIACADGLER